LTNPKEASRHIKRYKRYLILLIIKAWGLNLLNVVEEQHIEWNLQQQSLDDIDAGLASMLHQLVVNDLI
jgi:hypothetical protein